MKAFETREQVAERDRQQRKTEASVPDDNASVTVTDGLPQMKAGDLARKSQRRRLAQHDAQSGDGGGNRINKKGRRRKFGSSCFTDL